MPDSTMAANHPAFNENTDHLDILHQLSQAVPAGIAYLDHKQIVLAANHIFSQTLGLQEGSLAGRHISTIITDAGVLRAIETAATEGKPAVLNGNNHDRRGHWQWSINPITKHPAGLDGVLIHLIDLTEHIVQRANPAQFEARLHNIVHSAPLLLCVVDHNGRILICEGKDLERLGYVADELIGCSLDELLPNRQDILGMIRRAMAGEDLQTEIVTSSGEVYAANFQAYRNARNEVVGVVCNALNITTGKKYEQELKRSEERFRTSVENMHDPFVLYSTIRDEHGKIVDFVYEYANHAALKANGSTAEKMIGKRLLELLPKHMESGLFDRYCQVIETGEPLVIEDVHYEDAIDGYPIGKYFDIRATRLDDKLALTWRNVTDRKLYQDELIRQQRLLETVLEALPVGIWLVDKKGKVIKNNPAGREIWGRETFHHQIDRGPIPGYDPSLPMEVQTCPISQAILHGKSSLNEVIEIETTNGVRKIIQNSTIPIRDSKDAITGALVVDQDITQLKQVEQELIEVKHQLQKSIENERMRLAKDLHDGPLQTLLAASYLLEDQNGLPASTRSTAEAQRIILDVIDRLREIYGKLRPVTVAHYGLVKAMRFYLDEFQKSHPEMAIQQELEEEFDLPELTRLILFRSFKQLLDNIERHSNASTISVRIRTDQHWVILEVNDDGDGFTFPRRWVDLAYQGHLGLLEVKESIEAIGGYLVVDSTPHEGTRARILARRFINPSLENQPAL